MKANELIGQINKSKRFLPANLEEVEVLITWEEYDELTENFSYGDYLEQW